MKNRFERLVALTRGAAVVTLGVGAVAAGCTKNDPSVQPPVAVAGTVQPEGASSADPAGADASDGDGGRRLPRRFPIPNAMHGQRFHPGGPSDGGTDGSSGP
jgi:hypothetical protein